MTDKVDQSAVQDGFDLIQYPCDYGFKAMCKVDESVDIEQQLCELVLVSVQQQDLLSVTSNNSRTGKFVSVTLTVRLQDRVQLEAIYQAVSAEPYVVMTL